MKSNIQVTSIDADIYNGNGKAQSDREIQVCMYEYICMSICMSILNYIFMCAYITSLRAFVIMYLYVCMYVCIYVYVCTFVGQGQISE